MTEDSSKPNKPPRVKLTKGDKKSSQDQPEIPKVERAPLTEKSAPPKVGIPRMPAKEATSPLETPPTGISRPKDETSPIVSGIPTAHNEQTTRVDLSSAQPASGDDFKGFDQTMPVDIGHDEAPKGETSRIDLSQAQPAGSDFDPFDSNETMRIDFPESASGGPSSETSPIDAPPVARPSNGNGGEQTIRVDLNPSEETSSISASSTAPVNPSDTTPSPTLDDDEDLSMKTMRVDLQSTEDPTHPITPANASMQTMRIEIPEGIPAEKKAETSRISLSATQSFKEATGEIEEQHSTKSKSGTIRLGEEGELHELIENQDSINQQTMRIELDDDPTTASSTRALPSSTSSSAGSVDLGEVMGAESKAPKAGAPKTIRIRKTDTPPPTRVMKKPPEAEKTIQVQGTEEDPEVTKSGTTRIELPPGTESGPADKKTIRIRRPGAATGPGSMAVARSSSGFSPTRKPVPDEEETIGWIYTAVAALTLILVGVTLYVLGAQIASIPSDGVSWPWIGQI